MRRIATLLLLVTATACNVDALLESEVPPDIRLTMAASSNLVSLTPGVSQTVNVSVTRLGDYKGPVAFEISGIPSGVTATQGTPTTNERVTTISLTFAAGAAAAIGDFTVTVRGTGSPTGLAAGQITLRIVARPAVTVAPTRQSLTIIRGGISPLTVAITRINFTGTVGLSLTGNAGFSLGGATSIAGTTAAITVAVEPSVAPGTYTLALRAVGEGADAGEAPLTVVVPPDALQVLAADIVASQATAVTQPVTVNRNGVSASVAITVEGLPAGSAATLVGGPTAGTTANLRITIGASVTAGEYNIRLRAQATGTPDVTGDFRLTITASNVAMTLVPQSVTMLQGSSASSVLTLVRNAFTGAVSVEVLDVPPGITITGASSGITGSSATLVVQSANSVAPNLYSVRVRVVPSPTEADAPALDPISATLAVTVLEAPPFAGNVVLDWSRCVAPTWVAAQNGSGAWTRLTGLNSRFSFSLTSARGAFAYDDGGTQVVVRFGTGTELASAPIDLCPAEAPAATHSVTGTAQHSSATETFTWRLGGGAGISTLATPNFTIEGVRPGTHDLIGWGVTQPFNTRMFIARDVNEPPGGFVGTTTLVGQGSFTPATGPLLVPGFQAERLGLTMSYLTTAACTQNDLFTSSNTGISGTLNFQMLGVPALYQRPTDFHFVQVTAASTNSVRAVNLSFQQMSTSSRTVSLPTQVFPSVTTIAGSTKRLRLVLGSVPPVYNGSVTLRYSDGSRSASVTASAASLSAGVLTLDFPDFDGVPGFNPLSTVSAGATGSWTVVLDGTTGERTRCAEGASTWSVTRTGTF